MWLAFLIAHFVAAFLLISVSNWASLTAYRRAATAHWTEKARLLWPVRFSAQVNVVFVVFILWHIHWLVSPTTLDWFASDCLASVLGGMAGSYRLQKVIFPEITVIKWVKKILTWILFFTPVWTMLALGVFFMPTHFGWRMVLVTGLFLIFQVGLLWSISLKFLVLIKLVAPAKARLQQIVSATALQAGIPVKATWELQSAIANAVAFPITKELLFTSGLLETCNDEEVSSICAHELGHLSESKKVLVGRVMIGSCLFPLIFINPLTTNLGWAGCLLPYFWILLCLFVNSKLGRRMEVRADKFATEKMADPRTYAIALEKLYQANLTPAVMPGNRKIHPHLYDRMVAAGVTPDFPRPAKAKRLTFLGWVFFILCLGFVAVDLSYCF